LSGNKLNANGKECFSTQEYREFDTAIKYRKIVGCEIARNERIMEHPENVKKKTVHLKT